MLAFTAFPLYNKLNRKEVCTVGKSDSKSIAQNKKAYHDYFVLEKYEAGIALYGTEVKSLRQGAVNLKDSYCEIKNGELFALGVHISPYEKGNIYNRSRFALKNC